MTAPTTHTANGSPLSAPQRQAMGRLAKHWPAPGGRHAAYSAMVGGLLRAGSPVGLVEAMVANLAERTGDEEISKRVGQVAQTAQALSEGRPVTGWPRLAELLGDGGPETVTRVRGLLGLIVTVETLAQHKQLPVEFLREVGLHDLDGGGVGIQYPAADGRVLAVKTRTKLAAGAGSYWPRGTPLVAYGLDRLAAALNAGRLTVVEGESDAWTLWFHDEPALGLPGADTVGKTLDEEHVAGVSRCYVVQEPDVAGEKFVQNVCSRLAEVRWQGELRVVKLEGHKDPSELHCADPGNFAAAWKKALDDAVPLALNSAPPERKCLLRSVPPYRAFPTSALPCPLDAFVSQTAAALGCDATYVALPALAAVAAAIGNTRRVRLKRSWTEPALGWFAVVGESGTLKSPGQEAALEPLERIEARLATERQELLRAYGLEKERYQEERRKALKEGKELPAEPERPLERRVVVCDVTIERLAELMEDNPRGLLLAREELAGWLGSFARYRGRSAVESSDLPYWLAIHGARPLRIDRKTGERRTVYVPRAAASVVGGIQPGTLARCLTPAYFEAGLVARLLLAMPPRRAKSWTEAEVGPEIASAYEHLLEQLLTLDFDQGEHLAVPFVLRLSPDAKARWTRFYDEWATQQAATEGEIACVRS